MPLQPRGEPLPLLGRFPLTDEDLVLLALRARPWRFLCAPAEQTSEQTSHNGIATQG